jgi:type II secretory pathway pseudopilin PulG
MCLSSAPKTEINWSSASGLRRRSLSGMTLVELMTSMIVASVIMVALLQTLSSASESWTQQSKNFSAQREGRVGMRILADDLAAAVVVPQWARDAATASRNGGLPNGGAGATGGTTGGTGPKPSTLGINDPRTGYSFVGASGPLGSARLSFLRATGTDESVRVRRGDLTLVMYGVAISSDGGASGLAPNANSQKLVRRVFTPQETFRRLRALMEDDTPLVSDVDWQALVEMRDEPGVASTGVVAHDVIRFDLRPFDDLAMPSAPSLVPAWQPPKWMDFTLRVTNRQTGQYLETANDWNGSGVREDAILNGTRDAYDDDPEVKTYTMRLRMPTNAL